MNERYFTSVQRKRPYKCTRVEIINTLNEQIDCGVQESQQATISRCFTKMTPERAISRWKVVKIETADKS